MKILNILKEVLTFKEDVEVKNEHEAFMKLMQWGCYHDVNKLLQK